MTYAIAGQLTVVFLVVFVLAYLVLDAVTDRHESRKPYRSEPWMRV